MREKTTWAVRGPILRATAACLITLSGCSGLCPLHSVAEPDERPNLIVIVADDLGYADVGFHGCKDIATPNLDSIAKGGVKCSSAYVSHLMRAPSRAGLLTGRSQNRFGIETNPVSPAHGPPTSEVLLPQILQKAGYVSGLVGKWHLGETQELHPLRRGFNHFFGFIGGGHDYFRGPARTKSGYAGPLEHDGKQVELNGYLTDVITDAAIDFVQRHRDRPFFLHLAYNAPHEPLQSPEKYLGRQVHIPHEKRRTYAAMVTALDDGVGRLLSALRDLKLEERTVIFFFSDNGGPSRTGFDHPSSNASLNKPLRGEKGTFFEGGIRVPFLVQWRGRLPEGKTYDRPVSSLDVFATAAALAGVSLPSDREFDSVNLIPFLIGECSGSPHDRLFWRMLDRKTFAVREGRYKLIQTKEGGPWLYDLQSDLRECDNIIIKYPEIARRMLEAYHAWDRGLPAPRWHAEDEK